MGPVSEDRCQGDFIEATQKLKEYLNNGTAGLQSEAEDQPRKRRKKNCQFSGPPTTTTTLHLWNTRRLGSVGETLTVTPPERHPPFMSPDFSYPELSTLNASDGRDQGGRGHFTQLMGPTTPRNEHVFRPTFRVGGDSGPIPCTAAELHGLLLLEHIKQQVNQLAGTLNILMAKVGSGLHAPTYEMPEEFQFPLDSYGELERFEEWLLNPLNERMKTNLATSLSSVGGVDTKRVVWNILARMITCTVARRINWKGVNGKRAFNKMAMKIVLF
ncbi:hypothetical protein CgunFtcFv8_027668, partial [Champsocephalus gunnari]